MTFHPFQTANNAIGTLKTAITSVATQYILNTNEGNLFPDPSTDNYFVCMEQWDTQGRVTKRELRKVTAKTGDTFTATRAADLVPISYATLTQAATALSFDPLDGEVTIRITTPAAYFANIIAEMQRLEIDKANQADVDALTNIYAAASGGTDTYAFTIPGFTGYSSNVGKTYKFLADVPNTGASAVNISGFGSVPMYKGFDNDTVTGDIKANQIITIVIGLGGTSVQMTSQVDTIVDLSSYATRSKTYTISGGVVAGDVVYPSAADTVKKLYASDIQTLGASPTTSPSTNSPCRVLPISNGLVLQVSGSDGLSGGYTLKAQVRTINALETDFSNGSEATLFGSAVTWFDVCQIDTSTWIAIYNKGASGAIACVAFTISGTTITVGSEQSIEASGTTSWKCSIAKVDTLKCLITYMKASDSKPYVQVLTVSGTTITTNTPVLLKNSANALKTSSCQITTNQVLIVYGDSVSTVFAVTVNVSGTTPTVNSEATVQNIGTGSQSAEVKRVSDTKAVCVIETGGSNELGLKVLSLSGTGNNTISAGATTTITGANASNNMRGLQIVGEGNLILSSYRTTPTDMYVRYYTIGSTTTTLVSTQTTAASSSAPYPSVAIGKISPWTYLVTGMAANSDFIIKLNPVSSARVGVAEGTIADAATGAIAKRFNNATLSALTVGSKYYADDNGNITLNSSLTAPEVGYADSTTNLILT